MINWMKEAEKYKDEMIRDLEGLISIPSLRNDEEACEGAPFGKGAPPDPLPKTFADWVIYGC